MFKKTNQRMKKKIVGIDFSSACFLETKLTYAAPLTLS